jgi:hypothetical protein
VKCCAVRTILQQLTHMLVHTNDQGDEGWVGLAFAHIGAGAEMVFETCLPSVVPGNCWRNLVAATWQAFFPVHRCSEIGHGHRSGSSRYPESAMLFMLCIRVAACGR